jgi:hypothetical protein
MNQLPPPAPAPGYSKGLEFAMNLLLRGMTAPDKLALARRMLEVCKYVEAQALDELGSSSG